MMYIKNEHEIREWILYGHPKRLEEKHSHAPASDHVGHADEDRAQDSSTQLPLRMPGYEGVISKKQLEALFAFYKAVAAFDAPPPRVRAGYQTASRLGCFGCHGPGGRVGSKNPRSFKGYIPRWQGKDYAES